MLIFSNTCQYAIKSCIILATEKRKIRVGEISKQIGTPIFFTSKILQELTRKGLISSGNGRGGGFFLNSDQYNSLTIKDIYENIQGTEALDSCLLGLKVCGSDAPCPVHHIAVEIKEKVKAMFLYKIKELKDLGSVSFDLDITLP